MHYNCRFDKIVKLTKSSAKKMSLEVAFGLCRAGSLYDEGVDARPGQKDDRMCVCRLHSVTESLRELYLQ